jgi:hypothetical protein
LPAGVKIVEPASTSTTCPSGVVNATGGGTTISAAGNLSEAMVSCTVTVRVTSDTEGTYVSGPSNVTSVGINLPGSASLKVNKDLPALAATGSGSLLEVGGIVAIVFGVTGLVLLFSRRKASSL